MKHQTDDNIDEEGDKKKEDKYFVLDAIENLLGIDEFLSVPNLTSKGANQDSNEINKVKKERKRVKKIDDIFQIDPDIVKLDVEEFKRQIKIQKEIFLNEIKNNTPKRKKKVRKIKNMEDFFGDLENLDPKLLKKTIQEKKEEYIRNIKNDNLTSSTSQKEISSQVQVNAEKTEMNSSMTKVTNLDAFSDELQNMNIDDLRLELQTRKNNYKNYIKNIKVVEIAKDLSHLEMIITHMSSISPEISHLTDAG